MESAVRRVQLKSRPLSNKPASHGAPASACRTAICSLVQTLLDQAPDAMAVLDGEGRLILAGAALALASGRPACELAGLQVGELGLFGEEAQRVTQAAQRAALDRQARNLDLASGLCVRFVPDVASPATAPQVWMLMQDHRGFHALEAELRAREREFRTLAVGAGPNMLSFGRFQNAEGIAAGVA